MNNEEFEEAMLKAWKVANQNVDFIYINGEAHKVLSDAQKFESELHSKQGLLKMYGVAK
jgi:hypothetical protein